jgi:hypothetical protein
MEDVRAGSEVEKLLPVSSATGTWKLEGKHSYTPDDLYNYINGAADLFISYGFVELGGGNYNYETDGQGTVVVDIYDMGKKLNAFGVFQSKRDPEVQVLEIGAGAIGNQKYIFFYKDRFYVEIQALSRDEKDSSVALTMAREVESKIPGDSSLPAELNYLPNAGRVMGSAHYITGGILGHGFLDKGLLCNYRANGEVVKAFIAFFPSPDQAFKALNQYKGYLEKAGETWKAHEGFGDNSFTAQEPYHKTILVAQQGAFVVGIADLSSAQKGEALLKRILNTIQNTGARIQESEARNQKQKKQSLSSGVLYLSTGVQVASCRNKTLVHRRDAKDAEITRGNNNYYTSPCKVYLYCCPEDSFV